jgi:hypothetical protein
VTGRHVAFGVALALAGLALPSAQGPTHGFSIEGWWKMDGEPGFVMITRDGTTVKGDIFLGGVCFDGKYKPYAIDGKLSSTITPGQIQYTLTGKLWVCTGSPDLVKKCGGGISSAYETTIIDATVEPNRISGNRVVQGVLDCRPNSTYDDTRSFLLTRHACTEQEFQLALANDYLRFMQGSAKEQLEVFVTAHDAARARYGDTFTFENTTWQTNWLQNPYMELRGEYPSADAFVEHVRQVVVVNPDRWLSARTTAQLMVRDLLRDAAPMVSRMSAIEELWVEAPRALEEYKTARKNLDDCRRANPSAPR